MVLKKKVIIFLCFLCLLSLLFVGGEALGLKGTDDMALDAILEINGGYEPWAESIWSPPSGEIEFLLFALQASAGMGFILYYLGRKKNAKVGNGICKDK